MNRGRVAPAAHEDLVCRAQRVALARKRQDAGRLDATLDVTVVWPDSCGSIIDAETAYSVVGRTIIVELAGFQAGGLSGLQDIAG